MTSQALEDACKRQRRPQMGARAPEGLRPDGRAIDNGSSATVLEATQCQWTATIE